MNTEKQTLQRVQGALYHLRRGLAPFVETRMKARHGAQWLAYASRATGGEPRAAFDEYGLLKTMIDNWREVFEDGFPRAEKQRVRNFVSTALEAREARYTELLRLSYPIHPGLFDRLSKDWASLEKFQRTRGVLRFMANVVGVLWQAQTRDPLIMPGRVPVAHERVRASVLYPLDPLFSAVVDREVDGDGSLPARMEANPTRARVSALTRGCKAK